MCFLCDVCTGPVTNRGSSFEDFSLSGADPSESVLPSQTHKLVSCHKHRHLALRQDQVHIVNHLTDYGNKPS